MRTNNIPKTHAGEQSINNTMEPLTIFDKILRASIIFDIVTEDELNGRFNKKNFLERLLTQINSRLDERFSEPLSLMCILNTCMKLIRFKMDITELYEQELESIRNSAHCA